MSNFQCKIGVYIADMSSASGGFAPEPRPGALSVYPTGGTAPCRSHIGSRSRARHDLLPPDIPPGSASSDTN